MTDQALDAIEDRLLAQIEELRQKLATERKRAEQAEADALEFEHRTETAEAEIERMRALAAQAQLLAAQLTAERDALRAWKAAVPVGAIARVEKVARYLLSQTGRGAGGPAVDDCLAIQAWLATRPEVQP